MLVCMPLALSLDPDAGAFDQQVQQAFGTPMWDIRGQSLLAAAERAEVRHLPVQADQLLQALDDSLGLARSHAEHHLHRQAFLYSGIAVGLLSAAPTCRRGIPAHLGVKPDRQRVAALERFVIGWPVPGLAGRGGGLLMLAR